MREIDRWRKIFNSESKPQNYNDKGVYRHLKSFWGYQLKIGKIFFVKLQGNCVYKKFEKGEEKRNKMGMLLNYSAYVWMMSELDTSSQEMF